MKLISKDMKTIIIYIDHLNRIVYANNIGNLVNDNNSQLRKYIINPDYFQLFIQYYGLRLHKEVLNHIVQ
jgi:hypothetical protein